MTEKELTLVKDGNWKYSPDDCYLERSAPGRRRQRIFLTSKPGKYRLNASNGFEGTLLRVLQHANSVWNNPRRRKRVKAARIRAAE
jgi:hypothetical protein